MSQTILIEPNQNLRKIYHLNLVTYTGTNVIERADSNEAIELLKLLPNIDLIVCASHIAGLETAKLIYNFLQENNLNIPLIISGEYVELSEVAHIHTDKQDWEGIVKLAANVLGVSKQDLLKKVTPDFVSIGIFYFYDIDHTPCDVYIKINKTPLEHHFVKRIHAQDDIKPTEIDKYIKQNLKELYIRKDYQQYFVTFVTNTLMEKLDEDLEVIERLKTNSSAYEIAKEHIQLKEINEETEELIYACIKSMATSIKESPKLAGLLTILFQSRISFAYQKAHLTCFIGNYILSKQKWYEPRHLELMTYLSFLSDITLKSVEQLKIATQEELNQSKLSDKEKKEVLEHAYNASLLVCNMQGGSEYLELLVKQHHGSNTGKDFPNEVSDSVHPIGKVFIVADHFVKILLNPDRPNSKKEILTILYQRFEDISFHSIIKVLEQKMG